MAIIISNGLQTDVEQYAQRRRLAAEYKRQEDQAYNHSMARKSLESRQYQGWVDRVVAARPDLFMLSDDKRHQYKVRAAVARQNGILTNVSLDNAAQYLLVKDMQKEVANEFKQFVKDAVSMFKGGKKTAVLSTVVAMYFAGCTSDDDEADIGNDANDTPDITHYLPTDDLPPTPTYVPTKPTVSTTPEPTTPTPEPITPTPGPADKCPDEKNLPEQYLDADKCLVPELRDGDSDRAIDGNNIVLNLSDEQQRVLANYIDAKFQAVYKILNGDSREYLGERTAGTNSTLQDTEFDGIADGEEIAAKLGLRTKAYTSDPQHWPDPLEQDIYFDVIHTRLNGTLYRPTFDVYGNISEKFAAAGFRFHIIESPVVDVQQRDFTEDEASRLFSSPFTFDKKISNRLVVIPYWTGGGGFSIPPPVDGARGEIVVNSITSGYDPENWNRGTPESRETRMFLFRENTLHEMGHALHLPGTDDNTSIMYHIPIGQKMSSRTKALEDPNFTISEFQRISNRLRLYSLIKGTE